MQHHRTPERLWLGIGSLQLTRVTVAEGSPCADGPAAGCDHRASRLRQEPSCLLDARNAQANEESSLQHGRRRTYRRISSSTLVWRRTPACLTRRRTHREPRLAAASTRDVSMQPRPDPVDSARGHSGSCSAASQCRAGLPARTPVVGGPRCRRSRPRLVHELCPTQCRRRQPCRPRGSAGGGSPAWPQLRCSARC